VAFGSYSAGIRELIHLLKYDHLLPAANVLGRMLAESISRVEPYFRGPVLVIPVPLHARKLRARGFNQSELIARKALKLMNNPHLIWAADRLVRVRETQSQIGLTSHQRRQNMRGAFAVSRSGGLKGQEVLLIDDVYTTGTTVGECSRVLQRAGASKIWVVTVARTLKAEIEPMKTVEDVAAMAARA
jgi:ComF family protein